MKKLYISLLLLSFISIVKSQTNLNLYNFRNVGQSNLINPGIRPQANVTVGIPGIYFSAKSPNMTINDIFNKGENPDSTIKRIVRDDNLSFNNTGISFVFDPLFVGFAIKKNYFSFGAQLNFDFYGSPPKDILGLTQGSTFFQNSLNRQISLGNLDFNTTAWTAYHIGYTREINKKLSVGIRLKYLQGLFNANVEESTLQLSTNSDSLYVRASFKANTAGAEDFRKAGNINDLVYGASNNGQKAPAGYNASSGDIMSYISNRGIVSGTGWGIDLGANYKFNQHTSISASLIDLGYINWNKNNNTFSMPTTVFNYKGQDINSIDSLNNSEFINNRLNALKDSLLYKVFVPKESADAYTTYLNAKLYLGAQYAFNYNNTFDFVFFNNFGSKQFNPALSLTFTKKIWSIMDIRVSGTYYNKTFNNAGLGFSLNLGTFQTYLFSDNLVAAINYDDAKFINVRTGINWNFGRNPDRDGDGIPNEKDKCWKKYGSIEMKGCPDTDKDGISDDKDECVKEKGKRCTNGCPDADKDCVADYKDSCVNDSGSVRLNGCPDKDKDGIADKYDNCPDVFGLAKFDGCPDSDSDGIMDNEDACPKEPGSIANKGCPDTDGDGILDMDDECPTERGLKRFKGCPDIDEDGIMDKLDSCMFEKGPASLNGCPDSDGDEVMDKEDKCPQEFGTAANQGCPAVVDTNLVVLTVEEKKVINEAFSNLEFETGTSKIKESSLESLTELAELLSTKPEYKLRISGFTDNVGKAAANLKLSQTRANAVRDFLVSKGVDKPRLFAMGFGSKKPVADNKTAEGRQRNRRVEFQIIK